MARYTRTLYEHERGATQFPEARAMGRGERTRVVHAVRNTDGIPALYCREEGPGRWRPPETEVTCKACWFVLREEAPRDTQPPDCPYCQGARVGCTMCEPRGPLLPVEVKPEEVLPPDERYPARG